MAINDYSAVASENQKKAETIKLALLAGLYPMPCKLSKAIMFSNGVCKVIIPEEKYFKDVEFGNLVNICKAVNLEYGRILGAYKDGIIDQTQVYEAITQKIVEGMDNVKVTEKDASAILELKERKAEEAENKGGRFYFNVNGANEPLAEGYLATLNILVNGELAEGYKALYEQVGLTPAQAERTVLEVEELRKQMEEKLANARTKAILDEGKENI